MQLTSRHLVRYLFVSLLLSQRDDTLPACEHFLKQTAYKYTDVFTDFVHILTHTFAFDSIPETLAGLQKVCCCAKCWVAMRSGLLLAPLCGSDNGSGKGTRHPRLPPSLQCHRQGVRVVPLVR